MPELVAYETRTYETQASELIRIPFVVMGVIQLALPFVAPILPVSQQNQSGLWPAYVAGPILAAPFFMTAIGIQLLGKFRRITIDNFCIAWQSGIKNGRLEWDEILAFRESARHGLSFEFETRRGLVSVPIAGLVGLDELRAITRSRIPSRRGLELASAYEPWKVWTFLAIIALIHLALGALSGWLKDTFSPPFTNLQLTVVTSYLYLFPIIFLRILADRQANICSAKLTDEALIYREFTFKHLSIPYKQIVQIERKETKTGLLWEVVVQTNNSTLVLSRSHPDLELIWEELSRRSNPTIRRIEAKYD